MSLTGPRLTMPLSEREQAEGIVFSKDRAMQLHALLSSYRARLQDPQPLTVLFSASTPEHLAAYKAVAVDFESRTTIFVEQTNGSSFRVQFLALLRAVTTARVFFLVDDIVFIEPFDLGQLCSWASSASVPSMRLGRNIEWAYTSSEPQRVPRLRTLSDQLVAWRWARGELDWAYPLSLDGNVFMTEEMLRLATSIPFTSPNTLEEALQRFRRRFSRRWGVCFAKSRVVNLPLNRVQNEIMNLHGDLHQDDLLKLWHEGMQINVTALVGFVNRSVHEDIEPVFSER